MGGEFTTKCTKNTKGEDDERVPSVRRFVNFVSFVVGLSGF